MRRSYEYKKEESYIVHKTRDWNYPSYEDKYPNTYKVDDAPSYNHHDGGSSSHNNGWSRTQHVDNNLLVKKNEHHASRANTILRRLPLGSVNHPPSHQNRWGYGGEAYDGYKGGSSSENSSFMVMKNKHEEDSKPYVGLREFEDYDDGKFGKALNYLIKQLDSNSIRGGTVKKIEVIQYERTTYGGGYGSQRKDPWLSYS